MSAGGSQQLRIYRRSRRDGMPLEQAAAHAGIPVAEARLHDAEDAKSPPPAEAYEPISEDRQEQEMGALDDVTTVKIGNGPEIPFKDFKAAAAAASQGTGHNSEAANWLRIHIERHERLEEEKKGIADDQKDIMTEIKGRGYDVARVREILKIRKLKPGEYEEQQMVLETYMRELGMS